MQKPPTILEKSSTNNKQCTMVSLTKESIDISKESPIKVVLTPPPIDNDSSSSAPQSASPVTVRSSTPVKCYSPGPGSRSERSSSSSSSCSSSSSTTGSVSSRSNSDPDRPNGSAMDLAIGGPGSLSAEYNTPVIGYEVMEERTRFTVFKLWVEPKDLGDGWFVFRRYTDFLRLNRKLREMYPGLRLVLPPKKWFGDNFDPCFLDDRTLGLQAYVTNITNHPAISQEACVREFFCLDSKPDAHDSLEESRAICQSLEQKVHTLKRKLKERDSEIKRLQAELTLMKTQQDTLIKGLKLECSVTAFTTQSRNLPSRTSTPKDSSFDHDKQKLNKVLGIHNVNVTLLHMMESALGKENIQVNPQIYEKSIYPPSEILSDSLLTNGNSQLKIDPNVKSSSLQANNIEGTCNNNNNKATVKNSKLLSTKISAVESPS